MVMYPPMSFPGGILLDVWRPTLQAQPVGAGGFDPYGDPIVTTGADPDIAAGRVYSHTIGPVDVPVQAIRQRGASGHDVRARAIWDCRAPLGTDILKSDWCRLPGGLFLAVIIEPQAAPNPFTGWHSCLHFELEEVG